MNHIIAKLKMYGKKINLYVKNAQKRIDTESITYYIYSGNDNTKVYNYPLT